MILGIGIDSVEIARVAAKCGNTDSRFLEKMFTPLERARFQLLFQGRLLQVSVRHGEAEYRLLEGSELEIVHHGEPVTVTPDGPTKKRIPHTPTVRRPSQPSGRAPQARRPAGG